MGGREGEQKKEAMGERGQRRSASKSGASIKRELMKGGEGAGAFRRSRSRLRCPFPASPLACPHTPSTASPPHSFPPDRSRRRIHK